MILRFLDLFAGIGGFRMGMERAGHKCAGYVEIDEHARQNEKHSERTEVLWTNYNPFTFEKTEIKPAVKQLRLSEILEAD